MKRWTIKSLEGKTIKSAAFDTPYQEKIVVDFTDGTVATISPYQAGGQGAVWYALTMTVIEETE